VVNGRHQGFFHGPATAWGSISTSRRASARLTTSPAGQVVTVEPGLYYPEWGAVRIEDMVVVEAAGCRNLTAFPKDTLLEL